MKMSLRSKRSDRAVLGDVANKKRSASDAKSGGASASDAKRLKSSKGDGNWVSRGSKKDEVTNPLVKKEETRSSSSAKSSSLMGLPPPPPIRQSATTTTTTSASSKSSKSTLPVTTTTASVGGSSQSSSSSAEATAVPLEHRMRYSEKTHSDDVCSLDRKDLADPLLAANYITDMYQHLYRAQPVSCPGMYMDQQADINSKMRAILIDWLIEVHMKFKLVPETLYLCVNVIDRYCELKAVPRAKLQLVGVTALLIACKYEEIYPPEVRDCVYITDNAYTRQEVLDMEQDMLETLKFCITVPTAYPFLMRYLSILDANQLVKTASHYYTERTLQEHDMLKFEPSLVSCAAVYLAFNNEDFGGGEGYPARLSDYSGYSEEDIHECASLIAKKVGEEPVTASRRQLVAVKKKYSTEKFGNIADKYDNPSLPPMFVMEVKAEGGK